MSGRHTRASTLISDSILSHRPSSTRNRLGVCPQCFRRLHKPHDGRPSTAIEHNGQKTRPQSTISAAIIAAQSYLTNGNTSTPILPGGVKIDPFRIVGKEMKFLTKNIQQLLGSGHPVLDTVAKYYTQSEGKNIRPMLVLLMSQATSKLPKAFTPPTPSLATDSSFPGETSIDDPLSPTSVLSDHNPSIPSTPTGAATSYPFPDSTPTSDILPSQHRLAEITELIHTASLLHDDVLDTSTTRRSSPSANVAFGNRMAVLAGDFLLGRASVALARLRSPTVTELLATVIANLIEGEFMQLRNTALDEPNPRFDPNSTIPYYLQKTYLKSASLISKSCRAAALLGGCRDDAVDAAYAYGRNLGLAFQLVDDMLDFTAGQQAGAGAGSRELGKPAGADLELGLATAPLLFAWKECEELGALVGRKFAEKGDAERARKLVVESDGIEQTRALAQDYADKAVEAVRPFPDSEAKEALQEMCTKVMQRRK